MSSKFSTVIALALITATHVSKNINVAAINSDAAIATIAAFATFSELFCPGRNYSLAVTAAAAT